jgi:hypothetical protein
MTGERREMSRTIVVTGSTRGIGLGLALAALVTGCARPDTPQVQGPLAVEIPELCTVCVEVLRCEGDGRRVAYVMAEKSAWAQVVTIWDYFAAFFRPKTEDFRDLTVYELAADAATPVAILPGQRARLDVWQRRVVLPDSVVVQKTGAWLSPDGRTLGSCVVMPRGPDRQFKKALEAAATGAPGAPPPPPAS